MTPIDQRVIDEIVRLLSLIRVDLGYRTDAGRYVLADEPAARLPEDAITLEVLDGTEVLVKQARNFRSSQLLLTLTVNVPRRMTASPRARAREVLADIRRALSIEPRDFSAITATGCVTSMELGSRRLPARVEGSQYVTAEQDLAVTFTETQPVPTETCT